MPAMKSTRLILFGLIASVVGALAEAPAADAKGKAKVTYQEQVSSIFRNRCTTCHNADKQKGGLTLESYTGALQGGGSGKVIEPGHPDASTLLQLALHK